MPVVCGDNENAKCGVQFRMVKQEMRDEYPVHDFGDNVFPCFSVLPHWGTWDSPPVGAWRGWHCLCWPADLCSSLVNQASEKIPVGKIIFHKGKASLSVIISVIWFSMWCTAGLGYLSEGSAAWGQGWELCRADVPQIPGPGGRMAVHGQHDMEACLEWLQMEQHHYHLTHICWASVICWLQCHMDEKCAKREKCFSFGMLKKIKKYCIFNFWKGWGVFH